MRLLLLTALAAATPVVAATQQPASGGPLPPTRPLGKVTATSSLELGSLAAVRALPGGRVLVHDMARRRVVLLDSTLKELKVVADSTDATGNAYGGRMGGLIPYRGDSTLFVDPQSLSMLMIAPDGSLGRVLSVPRPNDAFALTGLAFGTPGFDAQGRLVYRTMPMPQFRGPGPGGPGGGAPMQPPAFPDSAPIIRVDLATRAVDTVAHVKVPRPRINMTQDGEGRMSVTTTIHPLPEVDDWAVLHDGTVAVLRGKDFHVDLIGADGKVTAAPKMPHDWQRMTDEMKVAFLDSTKQAMERQRAAMEAAGGGAVRFGTAGPAGGDRPAPAGPAGPGQMTIVMTGPGGEGGPPRRGGSAPAGGAPSVTMSYIEPSELPDYKPAFGAGAARADADGNLWVRLVATKPLPGPLYAVVDRTGKLVDRVVLPANSAIAGFGPGGVVYLGIREAAAGGPALPGAAGPAQMFGGAPVKLVRAQMR